MLTLKSINLTSRSVSLAGEFRQVQNGRFSSGGTISPLAGSVLNDLVEDFTVGATEVAAGGKIRTIILFFPVNFVLLIFLVSFPRTAPWLPSLM
jgi:hypothetical protein